MQLANLTALFWGLLAVPIVVFYVLKIRLRRVPVSTSLFWNQVFEDRRPRSLWQRLRHLVSLLLQLAFLALLVLALADPFLPSQQHAARRVVLVVDNSASMNARDVDPSRLDAAKRTARDLIDGLRWRDEMAIVTAGAVPRVACGLSNHQRTLRDTVAAIAATDGPTTVSDAVELARRLIAGRDNGEVIVLSDGCFAGAAALQAAGDVAFVPLGRRDAGNVGITLLQARRSLVDVVGYQILVEVSNFSETSSERQLELSLEGKLIDVLPLSLAPGEVFREVLDHTTLEGGTLRARLDSADALQSDDQAVALLPRQSWRRVLLVTPGNLFLQSVLESIPLVRLSVSDAVPESVSSDTILILHQQPLAQLPAGRLLIVDPQASTPIWELGELLEQPLVGGQAQDDSPLLAHVQLENVLLPGARELQVTQPHQALVSSIGDSPLYASIPRQQGDVLLLTVDLDQADLPLRTAFPILVTNALNWFEGRKGELQQAVAAGTVVTIQLREAAVLGQSEPVPVKTGGGASDGRMAASAQVVLMDPAGHRQVLPGDVDQLSVGPLDCCGVWQVVRSAEGSANEASSDRTQPKFELIEQIGCNLANPAESDLRTKFDAIDPPAGTSGWGGRPIWFYLALAGLVLTTAEWYLYQRRWIG